ncbi:MAG: DNA polymerase III subunit gamma/tau [Muribaculaceae bacterium]|nr:DNA polymerase III subunit gamma/tau [Muribaculaceae bacterium]
MAENYIVSARKYRPATFRTVVGQETLTHTLKTAIASGRLAHAYLFCGPRGVGKTTCARIFAKTINCEHPTPDGEACNQCDSCKAFNEQRSFNIIEMDAASNNGVDDMRELTGQVLIPPQGGRYKVYIIDEVHMLSSSAFNAFLKTLEEPPEYAIFIMATTEKQKVLPTILSRCQIYDFTRITVPDIVKQLQYVCKEEGIEAEPAALNVIAQKADGGMRDALSIFDQVTASSEGHITYQSAIDNLNVLDYDYYFGLVDTFLACDVPQALLTYREIRDKGFDSQFFVNGLASHLRDLMVASTPQTRSLLEMNQEVGERYVQQAAKLAPRFFYRALEMCNECDLNYRNASNKMLLVELLLVKLCQIVAPDPAVGVAQPKTALRPMNSASAHPSASAAPPRQAPPMAQPSTQAAPAAANQPPQPPTPPPPAPDSVPAPTPAAATNMAPPPPPPPSAPAPQAPAAPVTPAPAAAPQRRKVAEPKRILISNTMAGQPVQPQQATVPQPEATAAPTAQRETFTEQQLLEAWQRYIVAHPQEQLVVNTMKMAKPVRKTDETYQIEVASQGQVEFFENSKADILAFLRGEVKNDMLDIQVKQMADLGEHRIWTPREVVEDIKRHNEHFNDFLTDFDLGLA